jgi:hypothetical protein
MRHSASSALIAALCVLCLTADARCAEQSSNPEGYWSGWAERDGVRSDVAVRVSRRSDELSGTFDWPTLGYLRTDLLGVVVEGDSMRFSVPLPVGAISCSANETETHQRHARPHRPRERGVEEPGRGRSFELVAARVTLPYRIEDTPSRAVT